MKTKSKKYTSILNAARELFRQFGLKKVSIEEVCEKAGVSKMTFYKDFDNKNALAMDVLEKIMNDAMQEFTGMVENTKSFNEKFAQILELKHSQQDKVGLQFMEDALVDPDIYQFFMSKQKQYQELTLKIYKQGIKENAIRKDISPEYFMYLIEAYTNIFREERFKTFFPGIHERTDQIMDLFLFGVSNANAGSGKIHGGKHEKN